MSMPIGLENLDPRAPKRLLNRGLIAALVINAGGYYAGGTYEVIWSLFLEHLGAGLDLIGLTFAMFGLPVLLLSPFAGRIVDRRGSYLFIVIGCTIPAIAGIAYTLIVDPLLAIPLILLEATGFAMLNPALYSVVAANSPAGKSSTAQGLFGAAGTVGFIIASLVAGVLAAQDIIYPFYVFSAVILISLVLGLVDRWLAAPATRALAGDGGHRAGHRGRAVTDATSPTPPTDPTVLVIGGFLSSPPVYGPFHERLLARGARHVEVAQIWTPDWILSVRRGGGAIATRAARALLKAVEVADGVPLLVVGHSSGGVAARVLTATEPYEGRRFAGARRVGAIVSLGSPHINAMEHDTDPLEGERHRDLRQRPCARRVLGATGRVPVGRLSLARRTRRGHRAGCRPADRPTLLRAGPARPAPGCDRGRRGDPGRGGAPARRPPPRARRRRPCPRRPASLVRLGRCHRPLVAGRHRDLAGRPSSARRDVAARREHLTESPAAPTVRERGGAAAARRAHNPKVTGSNPVPATNAFP